MFRFGWLTVTTEDLAIWEQFPNAVFTLVRTDVYGGISPEEIRAGALMVIPAVALAIIFARRKRQR
jgi:hypothetical protein